MYTIYLIQGPEERHKYIGLTRLTLEERFKAHWSSRNSTGRKSCQLSRTLCKYGKAAFTITAIASDIATLAEAAKREIHWIATYNTFKGLGMNATAGGEGTKGQVFSAATKAKMSKAKKGIPLTEAHKLALRSASRSPLSAATKAKIARNNKKRKHLPCTREALSKNQRIHGVGLPVGVSLITHHIAPGALVFKGRLRHKNKSLHGPRRDNIIDAYADRLRLEREHLNGQ